MTNAIKTKKTTFKSVEGEWFDYHETLKEIARIQEAIMNPFDDELDSNTGGGKNSVRTITDPTGKMATRLYTSKKLSYLTEIVESIEKVYNALPDDYKKLVRVRYWSNKDLNWDGIAEKIHVHRSTAIRWRNEIIQATIEVLGWR